MQYDIIVVGHIILVHRLIKKLKSIGFRSVGFGITGTSKYQEPIDTKHFIFSNTYLDYFQQICQLPDNTLPTTSYTDYNNKLHETLIQQFEKVFNNLKVTKIEILSQTQSRDVISIGSIDDLVICQKPMVTYQGSDYHGKKIIYTSNYFNQNQSTIPDTSYNFTTPETKIETKNHLMSF